MMKRLLATALTVLALMSLVGCGASSKTEEASADVMMTSAPMPTEAPMANEAYYDVAASDAQYLSTGTSGLGEGLVVAGDAKMIYRANIDVQTLDYETSETALTELTKSCGGYFESRSLSNRASGYRYGEFVVRVPVAEYENFCTQIGNLCHVTYMSSSAENITESYYDTQSRLETAKIKLERLQSLLAKADNMADIITIESAISETEWTIESLSGTMRHYDALVDYATINLYMNEVYKLSGTETAPATFGERIGNALRSGWVSAGNTFEQIVVDLASAWVFVLVLAAAVIVIVRAVRRKGVKLFHRKKNPMYGENEPKQ